MRHQSLKARTRWARAHLERHGFEPGEVLGDGHHGAVFRHGPSHVVKLTDCWGEAYFFLWLKSIGGRPGFPHVELVRRIGKHKGSPAFAVLREDVPDLRVADSQRFHFAAEDLYRGGDREPLEQAWADSLEKAHWMMDEPCPLFGNLKATVKWALDQGCFMPWMHEGNLGMRGDTVVIRDLSGSWPPVPWVKENREIT